jgi:hypothetical protein
MLQHFADIFTQTYKVTTPPPIQTTKHTDEDVARYQSFNAPKGAGRVYFTNGLVTGASMFSEKVHNFPTALIVDGVIVGKINKGDVLVLDVKPGNYEFMWRSAYEGNDMKAKPLVLGVVAGEVLILKSEYNLGGIGFGLIASLLTPPSFELSSTRDRDGIQDLNFVKATTCPKSICPDMNQ